MATSGLNPAAQAQGLLDLARINWQAPWLSDWAMIGEPVAADALAGDTGRTQAVADALNRARARHHPQLPVHFVAQQGLPQGMAYEAFVRQQGAVPTRDNVHDFFNGLAWLHAPCTKLRLNQLQSDEIASMGVGCSRGPVRDAVTVLDENGAFLVAPPEIWSALRMRDWQRLFVGLRPQWAQCRLWPFGHALQEKLIHPRKPIVAHVYELSLQGQTCSEIDAAVCADLAAGKLAGKPFLPLPVLGIPGWWPDNEVPSFYDDARVFRPVERGSMVRNPDAWGTGYA